MGAVVSANSVKPLEKESDAETNGSSKRGRKSKKSSSDSGE